MIDAAETLSEPVEPVPHAPRREPLRKRLFVGSAYSLAATVIGQVFALLTSAVYARVLGTHDLGILAIYAQLAALAVTLAGLNLGTPITKFVAELRRGDPAKLHRFLSTVFTLVVASTALVSVGLVVFALLGGLDFYGSAQLTVMIELVSVFLILNSLTTIGSAVLQGLQKIRWLSIVGILSEAFTVPVMFVFLTAMGLVGAAVGGLVMVAFSTALLFGPVWREYRTEGLRLRLAVDSRSARALARYSLPFLGSTVVVRSALVFQTTFLALSLGFLDTGLFRVASTVARIVAFVPAAISIPLLPALSEMYATASGDQSRGHLTSIVRISAFVGLPFAMTVGLLAHPFVVFVYGVEYSGAAALAFVLVTAGFVDVINAVAVNSLLGEGRTWTMLALDVGQSAVLVVSTIAFVQAFGLLGIGYSALLTAAAYGVGLLAILARTRRIDLGHLLVPFGLAAGGFGLATLAIVAGGALENLYLGAILIVLSLAASWLLLEESERRLLKGQMHDVFRLRRRTPPSRR